MAPTMTGTRTSGSRSALPVELHPRRDDGIRTHNRSVPSRSICYLDSVPVHLPGREESTTRMYEAHRTVLKTRATRSMCHLDSVLAKLRKGRRNLLGLVCGRSFCRWGEVSSSQTAFPSETTNGPNLGRGPDDPALLVGRTAVAQVRLLAALLLYSYPSHKCQGLGCKFKAPSRA